MFNANPQPQIRLENPVSEFFEAFIVGNATRWEQWTADELKECAPDAWLDLKERGKAMPAHAFNLIFREAAAKHCKRTFVAQEGFAKGQHVVICGAGPSLKEHATEWCRKGDQVWGCNSALTWLHQHHRKVTHGFTVDQTPNMLQEWHSAPDVEYLIASTVHPHLVEHLELKKRRIRFFHNYVGIKKPPAKLTCPGCKLDGQSASDPGCKTCGGKGYVEMDYEDWLYAVLYAGTIRAGSGLNSVTRAIDVAVFGQAEKITVLGADHALRFRTLPPKGKPPGTPEHEAWLKKHVVMHADGGHPLVSGATAMTLEGWICPEHDDCECKKRRLWISKPDMLISAVFLVRMARKLPHLQIIGDTLPNALMAKSDDFLDRLPALIDSTGKPIKIW